MSDHEEDAQTAALQAYFEDNSPSGYGASFRAGWTAGRAYTRAGHTAPADDDPEIPHRRAGQVVPGGRATVGEIRQGAPGIHPDDRALLTSGQDERAGSLREALADARDTMRWLINGASGLERLVHETNYAKRIDGRDAITVLLCQQISEIDAILAGREQGAGRE